MTIAFSERIKLGVLFRKWCKEIGAKECPTNMVTFLEVKGLLDDKKVKAFLEKKGV